MSPARSVALKTCKVFNVSLLYEIVKFCLTILSFFYDKLIAGIELLTGVLIERVTTD